ncbi:MAG: hypothetical protein ABIY55_26135 [Kofleriaceae bacterium]
MRLLTAALALSSLAACSAPRTALIAGAATTLAGGLVLHHGAALPPDRHGPYLSPGGEASGEVALGAIAFAVGLGLLTGGAIGLLEEVAPAPADRSSHRM